MYVVVLEGSTKKYQLGIKVGTEKNPPVKNAGLSLSFLNRVQYSMPTVT
jgi:hypothetical protein